MKHLFYTLNLACAILFALPLSAQFWTDLGEAKGGVPGTDRPDLHEYRSFQLDWQALTQDLAATPMERNATDAFHTIQLPMRDGQMESFAIVEYYALHPLLAAKFPDIHTYWGIGIDNPTTTVRVTNSQYGIHAAILATDGSIFVETVGNSPSNYAVFMKPDGVLQGWEMGICASVDPAEEDEGIGTNPAQVSRMVGEELLTYRLAMASTPLFTTAAGGVSGTMTNMTNAINAVNGILERDVSIRMQLIANNDLLIFTNANNPYSNQGNVITTADENPSVFNPIIGANSYDLGHALTQFTNGFAAGVGGFGSICRNGAGGFPNFNNKANGCSAYENQSWSQFYVGTLAHEWGHQLNAHHNFNTDASSCNGARDPSGVREPGSGTTIMCYPGLCTPHNIQNFTSDYYHAGNIDDIVSYTRNSTGSTCVFNTTNTNNLPPVVDGGVAGLVLPMSTPFVLTGSATDPNGDAMTYCWESMDQGPASAPGSPSANAATFRSFSPVNVPTRTFPQITDVINNTETMGEHLPDYARDLTFRLTVRDGLGGMAFDDVAFEVTDLAGPFLVTYPNTSLNITAGNYEEVTWDVANTTSPLVDAQYVNIKLSTDGGLTYPHTVADSIPNDGSEFVIFPEVSSSFCRVRVEAADHIFFDISNANFTLQLPSAPGFTLFPLEDTLVICGQNPAVFTMLSSSLLGFTDSISLNFPTLPAGITANSNINPLTPGQTVETTFTGDGTTPAGVYPLVITGLTNSGPSDAVTLQLKVLDAEALPGPVSMIAPVGNANVVPIPGFSWTLEPNSSSYSFELATSPSFGSTVVHSANGITSVPYSLPFGLDNFTVYYWRVKGESLCGDGDFGDVSAFQTGNCSEFLPADLPLTLPAFGQPGVATSTVLSSAPGNITSVAIQNVRGVHDAMEQIEAKLISPNNLEVQLFDAGDLCNVPGSTDFDMDFAATGATTIPCPPTDGGSYAPVGDLSVFVGQPAAGNWSLEFTDNVNFDGGILQDWDLVVCTESFPAPELITNLTLVVNRWNQENIEASLLEAISSISTPANVTFTLVDKPNQGGLQRSGTTLQAGETFTQDDIDNLRVSYLHYGDTIDQDVFTFDVRNQAGGWIGVFTFNIEIVITTGIDPIFTSESLSIYPNPASQRVWVEIDEARVLEVSSVELHTIHGQVISQKTFVSGSNKLAFDLQRMTPGLYLVKINSDKGSQLEKLLISE